MPIDESARVADDLQPALRRRRLCRVLGLLLIAVPWLPTAAAAEDRPAVKRAPVKVTVDTTDAPDLGDWASQAKALVEKWHPIVAGLLPSDRFTPPSEVKIVFKKMKGVAYTAGNTIVIAADWIHQHPDDFGMVVHELTHVIQHYPENRGAGWLVEGIADYVRFYHYEPKTELRLRPRRASYRDGYRTTAIFLAWIEKSHGKDVLLKVNDSLRKGEYKDELFKSLTSKSLDDLWGEFVAAQERK
jgi:hypothetical protein